MRARNGAVLVAVLAGVAAFAPLWAGDPLLTDAAGACLLAGTAAAASLTGAAGRPCLALAAFAATGGYVCGLLVMHGHGTAAALVAAVACSAAAGGLLGLLGARLGAAAFLALGLVAAVGGGALVDAFPDRTGAAAGLGPLPALGVDLPGGSHLALGAAGGYHAALVVAAVCVLVAVLLLPAAPGRRWRATGGDRDRVHDAGLRPLRAEVSALATAGALAGACGALGALVAGVVTPEGFGPDAAVVPVAAALLAGRAGPAIAALIAVAEGMVAAVILPRAGYTGPPSAAALAAGGLALAVVASALLTPRLSRSRARSAVQAAAPGGSWPDCAPGAGRRRLEVTDFDVRIPGGPVVVRGLSIGVAPGAVHGLVGANGSGKSSTLRAVDTAWRARRPEVRLTAEPGGTGDAGAGGVPLVLLPQHGGGFAGCTVAETLEMAARAGGCSRGSAAAVARTWADRLGLAGVAGVLCERLAAGARRRVELARCLLLRPSVLLCDEPLAGLDGDDRAVVLEGLRAAAAAGVAIVLCEHDRGVVSDLATAVTELRRDLPPEPARAGALR